MIVECITNKYKDIPDYVYKGILGYDSNIVEHIEIGQRSIVYAITVIKKNPWYLVDVDGLAYPMYYPSQLFKILDGTLSKHWIIGEYNDEDNNNLRSIKIGFKELVEDDYFYGEFIEDNPENIKTFQKYEKLMRKEFPSAPRFKNRWSSL